MLNLDKGKKISPFTIPALLGNTASGIIGIELGAQGPNFGVASACAAGSHAIGEAMRFMQNGNADVMVTGGSEAAITPLSYGGFRCANRLLRTGSLPHTPSTLPPHAFTLSLQRDEGDVLQIQ